MSTPPKTVRVRICVVLANEGSWSSAGWKAKQTVADNVLFDAAYDFVYDLSANNINTRIYFIEADLEPPAPETIQGTVEEVEA